MTWLLLATGFTGALTLVYLARLAWQAFRAPPSVAAHFSPKGGCTDAIVRELRAARREVCVLAYGFTSRPIAEALVEAKLRGVHVDIVLDHSNEGDPHSDLPFLLEQGLLPLVDDHHGIAHNKVMLIDGQVLITGSFNFTHHAESSNAENLLILKGHPDLAFAYRQDFEAHKAHARAAEVKGAPAEHGRHHPGEPQAADKPHATPASVGDAVFSDLSHSTLNFPAGKDKAEAAEPPARAA
jgi:phosphatidylserine/phosphatidylglycerophosphate/cardiolipin synthase-like enzyme